jgi:hypothetical protein
MKKEKNSMHSNKHLDTLLMPKPDGYSKSPKRIRKIVNVARRETHLRDLLTHTLINIWKPLLIFGALFFVFINRQPKSKPEHQEI